jgi:hypothetical protein
MVALFVPQEHGYALPRVVAKLLLNKFTAADTWELREQFKFKREGGPKTIPLTIAAEPNISVARVQHLHTHILTFSSVFGASAPPAFFSSFFFLIVFLFSRHLLSGSETLCS